MIAFVLRAVGNRAFIEMKDVETRATVPLAPVLQPGIDEDLMDEFTEEFDDVIAKRGLEIGGKEDEHGPEVGNESDDAEDEDEYDMDDHNHAFANGNSEIHQPLCTIWPNHFKLALTSRQIETSEDLLAAIRGSIGAVLNINDVMGLARPESLG